MICIVLFFAFCPVIPYYICIMLKNSMHSIIMLIYIFYYLEITRDGYELNKKEEVIYVVLCILLGLTQNTGVYFVLLSSIPLIIKKSVNRRAFITGAILTFAVMLILLPKIIYPALNIFPGGKQEVLGTLFQQTARYVRDYGDEVTEDEIEVISNVVDYNTLVNGFNFDTSDDIKATYNLHATRQDTLAYLKVWAMEGLKHPDAYFRAILPICGKFFAMGYDINIFDHIASDEGIFAQISQTRPVEEYTAVTENYNYLKGYPGINILFQHALYTLWIPLFCVYATLVREKNKKQTFIVPFIINILFLIVSPMAYSRYALPMIFGSPILLYKILME